MMSKRSRSLTVLPAMVILLVVSLFLVYREHRLKRPDTVSITTSGRVDMCLSCHKEEKLDGAHDAKVVGCAPCHRGNPLAIEKNAAHKGMIKNPGDLRIVQKTCAINECHPADALKVRHSLMATNRGIIGTLLYYWGESTSQNTDITVKDLIDSGQTSRALDYYRKLCATCHLWKQKNDLPNAGAFFNEKGGGCSACHYISPPGHKRPGVLDNDGDAELSPEQKKVHPLITKQIPDDNCIRCHNRSGRIGLAYKGVFESEGYGTPYRQEGLTSQQMPGNRFYLQLADDIHNRKGMSCIDCHTRDEVMGDGTSYAHYEQQVEISCVVCHSTRPGITRKNNTLNNVAQEGGSYKLTGKNDGRKRELHPPKKGVCDFSGHRRLSCESCHSTWVPQCYGCHVRRDASKKHLDKLSHQETEGQWVEGRSYIRYRRPMLAVWNDEVVIVTPGCQDIVNFVDGSETVQESFNRFTMAAINPHTTQEKGRTCIDCHGSTKSVGLGEGRLELRDGRVVFSPIDQGLSTVAGKTVGMDAFVALDGTPLQHASRPDLRPFNSSELHKILRVGFCVGCHSRYDDPAWRNYDSTKKCQRPGADDMVADGLWPDETAPPVPVDKKSRED